MNNKAIKNILWCTLIVFVSLTSSHSFGQLSPLGFSGNKMFDNNGYHGMTLPDTVFYSDSKSIESVGSVAVSFDSSKTDLRVGPWTTYYPNGQKKAQGIYQIDGYYHCGSYRTVIYTNYKIGYWEYYYENTQIKAAGIYSLNSQKIRTNCGISKIRKSILNKSWSFYDEEGKSIKIKDSILTQFE